MSSFLARLGRASYRRRGLVSVAWLAVLGVVVALLVGLGGSFDDRFTIPGSESQDALDRLAELSPGAAGAGAQIVFVAPDGATVTDPAVAGVIEQVVARAQQAPQVESVISPFDSRAVSPDGRAALATVQYGVSRGELEDSSLVALEDATAAAEDAGLEVAVGGNAFASTGPTVGPTEFIGVGVAVLVLVLTFGSLLAAGMNLLTAFIGIGVGMGGLLLASNAFTLSSSAPTLALMIGLAVGIDYALFILSRHRTQLATGMDPEESAARATGTAGSAVVFAGLTVIIALCGLSVVGIPFLTVMGVGAAGTVLVAVLVALTLLPALLGFAGGRLAPKPGSRAARRELADAAADDRPAGAAVTSAGARWTRLITRRPLVTVVLVLAGLLALAIPAPQLQLALPDNSTAGEETTQRQAYDLVAENFGPGAQRPARRARAGPGPGHRPAVGPADRRRHRWHAHPGPRPVRGRHRRRRLRGPLAPAGRHQRAGHRHPGERPAGRGDRRPGGDAPRPAPRPRGADRRRRSRSPGRPRWRSTSPTGSPMRCCRSPSSSSGLALVLLLLVFRSILVPIKAAVGFLLSVGASFGAVVAVFQWGWLADLLGVPTTGPVISFLPVILMAVLFGLAMDYEVFLVSRMREEYVHGAAPRDAVVTGARHASRVVVAAALIMFSVFASFVAIEDVVVKAIAVGLAVGILVDAFVVRMTLVPAVLALLGRSAWWLPRWLDRLLPDLDVEGARLSPALTRAEDRHAAPVGG